MALTEPQVEAVASADYERTRSQGGSVLPSWASLPEETKEGYRQAYRTPASSSTGIPGHLYIGGSAPTSPNGPALWIPLDGSGNPLPPANWQVFA